MEAVSACSQAVGGCQGPREAETQRLLAASTSEPALPDGALTLVPAAQWSHAGPGESALGQEGRGPGEETQEEAGTGRPCEGCWGREEEKSAGRGEQWGCSGAAGGW